MHFFFTNWNNVNLGKISLDLWLSKPRLDTTHYTLSDLIGQTLPDVYHINRLKQARVMTSHGIVTSIKGLTEAETIPL